MIGTAFHPEDIYHEALKYDFEAYTYRGEAVPGDEAKDNVFLAEWPERWPPEAIEERKRALPAIEVDRQLRVITAAEGQRFFRPRYLQLARDRGAGLKMPASFTQAERAKAYADEHDCEPKLGYWNDIVAAGVDLSTGTEDGDDTAIFVQRVDVETGKKRPLHLRRGLWGEREILRNILQVLRLFEPAFFAVESDGQQLYIVQGLNDAGMMKAIGARGEDILRLTVIPTYSGGRIKAKTDPLGIRLLAMDFESGKWECPEDPEVERWLDELSLWTPDGHTGDYVSAHYQSEQGLRLGSMAGVYIPKAFREEEQREAAVGY